MIDFEFHLYPPTLRALPFDKVSTLLYVDRVGAPRERPVRLDGGRKDRLFKAVSDRSAGRPRDGLDHRIQLAARGDGSIRRPRASPTSVEEAQADYLVRYYILGLATGLIERMYWWQLVAPGYGLVDSRESPWRVRPSYHGLRALQNDSGRSLRRGDRRRRPPIHFSVKTSGDSPPAGTTARRSNGTWAAGREIVGRDGERSLRRPRAWKLTGVRRMSSSPADTARSGFTEGGVHEYERPRYLDLDQRIVHSREVRLIGRFHDTILADVQPGRAARFLDLPCGYGRFSGRLGGQAVIATSDLSLEMVRRTREHLGAPGAVSNATQGLPFAGRHVRPVFSLRFFHHVHDPADRAVVLCEFGRVSAGWVIVSFYRESGFHLSQRRFRRFFSKSRTNIKMLEKGVFEREARPPVSKSLGSSPLGGLHAYHLALLRKR